MEVRIRLQKAGKSVKGAYNWRIVALPRQTGREARALDILGYYDAAKDPAVFEFDQAKLDHWLSKGAQMSETVHKLVNKKKREK